MKITHIAFATVLLGGVAAMAADFRRHPHLHHAFEAIEHAKKQLSQANDDKKTEFGGHRAKAMELLSQAQQEIEASADYDNSNAK